MKQKSLLKIESSGEHLWRIYVLSVTKRSDDADGDDDDFCEYTF